MTKLLIGNWELKISQLHEEKKAVEEEVRKAQKENSSFLFVASLRGCPRAAKISLLVRAEIVEHLRKNREKMEKEDFIKTCSIYWDSLIFNNRREEDKAKHQEIEDAFEPFYQEWLELTKEERNLRLEEIRNSSVTQSFEVETNEEVEEKKEEKKKEKSLRPEPEVRSRTFKSKGAAIKWWRAKTGAKGQIFEKGGIYWVEATKEQIENKRLLDLEVRNPGVKEEPKEEVKEASRVEEIEEAKEIIEEEKKEDKEEPKEKNKKISKTAKAKIKREKRKIRKIQEKEKELRKLERAEKKLLKEQEKIAKELRKIKKAKLALLAKLKKAPEGSEGGETGGNKGKRGEGEKEEIKGFSKASRIKEAKEQIREEDREEWKKTKSLISRRRRAITEQGFKTILRDIANSKGEPKKVKSAIKKAKKFIEKIEIYEDFIRYSVRFASWAPAWFTNKGKVVLKLKTLVTQWLEKNEEKKEDKEDKKETPKAKVKGGSEGSEGGENGEGGETEGRGGEEGEDKEEPKEEVKEASRVEEIEEAKEIIEEEKKEDKEEPKKQEGTSTRDWQRLKEEIGNKKRYIINSSEIGWIAGRAEYKTKNIKGDLIENFKKMKKGLELIKKYEDLIETSRRFKDKQPWSVRWLKNKSPLVWKIQRFINKWLEENRQGLIEKFAYLENIPEEYEEEAKKYKAERDYWEKKSKEFWAKRTAELTAERERRRKEKKEEEE